MSARRKRRTKVEQRARPIRGHAHVVGTHIAVHDACPMEAIEGGCDRGEGGHRLIEREPALPLHHVRKILALDVVHDQADITIDLDQVAQACDTGLRREARQGASLAHVPVSTCRIDVAKHLERHLYVEQLVMGTPRLAKPAASDLLVQPEATYHVSLAPTLGHATPPATREEPPARRRLTLSISLSQTDAHQYG